MHEIPNAFVVPDMTARSHEQTLARRDWVQAYAALVVAGIRRIRICFALPCNTIEEFLVRSCVVAVQGFLPATIAFDPDLNTSKDDLLAALEVNAQLNDISVIDWIWTAFLTRTGQSNMIEECA